MFTEEKSYDRRGVPAERLSPQEQGSRVWQIYEDSGLPQREFCEKFGTSTSNLQSIMQRKRKLMVRYAEQIKKALSVCVDWLLFGTRKQRSICAEMILFWKGILKSGNWSRRWREKTATKSDRLKALQQLNTHVKRKEASNQICNPPSLQTIRFWPLVSPILHQLSPDPLYCIVSVKMALSDFWVYTNFETVSKNRQQKNTYRTQRWL